MLNIGLLSESQIHPHKNEPALIVAVNREFSGKFAPLVLQNKQKMPVIPLYYEVENSRCFKGQCVIQTLWWGHYPGCSNSPFHLFDMSFCIPC